ncbi:MAG TPA: hypothetical protein VFT79_06740 [Solirubrobacterales bacterium]|nr:hypothetical protein [Solirubrobacterales bacterium]
MSNLRSIAKPVVAVLAALLLLPAAATAYPLKGGALEGGTTTISFDGTLRRAMEAAGVKALPLKPGRANGKTLRLPVREGLLEPRFGSGYVFPRGGILLRAGKRSARLKRLVLNTGKDWLRGNIAGETITIARVDEVKARRTDFGIVVKVESLRLTPEAAAIISDRLDLIGIFRPYRTLGRAVVSAPFSVVPITGGEMSFIPHTDFLRKLETLGVAISTDGTVAEIAPGLFSYRFAEVKGELNRRLTHGSVGTASKGLKFVQSTPSGTREISWASLGINFENGFGGEGSDVALARWTGVSAVGPIGQVEFGSSPSFDPNTGELAGVSLSSLSPYAAGPLNEAFGDGKEVFKAGESLGIFSFFARVR